MKSIRHTSSLIFLVALLLVCPSAASPQSPSPKLQRSLRQYLKAYVASQVDDPICKSAHFAYAFTDLHGDGQSDAVVYLQADQFCGSGGCNVLVLAPDHGTFRKLGDLTISHLPVVLLPSSHNGYRDLGVLVAGGGILHGYESLVRSNGKHYDGNPSLTPKLSRSQMAAARVLIPANAPLQVLFP